MLGLATDTEPVTGGDLIAKGGRVIFTDTEAETSGDLNEKDLSEELNAASLRRSVFNITLPSAKKEQDARLKDYESKLQAEIRTWLGIAKGAKEQLTAVRSDKQIVDISMLPASERAFLEQAPDLQKFVRESLEFRKFAHVYLSYHVPEFLKIQENLLDICDFYQETRKGRAVLEMLANASE